MIVWELFLWLLTAFLLASVARWLGSPKGKLRNGLIAQLLLFLITCAPRLALDLITEGHNVPAIKIVWGVVALILYYQVVLRVFSVSTQRALILWAVLFVWNVLGVILAIAVVRPYFLEAFVLPTESMSPTLIPGNRFVVNKLAHPARWDLVTYHSSVQGSPVWCKRVVGLPGERLRFDQGNIYVNDQLTAAPPVVAGRYHASLPTWPTKYRDGQTIVLSDRELFLVGDNVDVSGDSRIYGPTDSSSLIDVVDFVYWPPSDARIVRH